MAIVTERECEFCWKTFKPKQNSIKFCCKRCAYEGRKKYSKCEMCWKIFKNPRWHKFCSYDCANKSKITCSDKKCPTCWKIFHQKNTKQKYCSTKCIQHFRPPKLKDKKCQTCWKIFHPEREKQKFCCKKCSQKRVWAILRDRRNSLSDTEKTNRISCRANLSPKTKSKVNIKYWNKIERLWFKIDEYDFPLWWLYYDLKVWNVLIEINPYPYHNSTRAPRWVSPKNKTYHIDKYRKAVKFWYKCIMVRDWTSDDEMLFLINNNFSYDWVVRLNRYNPRTKEHILDNDNTIGMEEKWFVRIYDCWKILISKIKTKW